MATPYDNFAETAEPIVSQMVEFLKAPTLGLAEVFYGDRDKIGKTPCATVESGPQTSELRGANFVLEHEITVFVILYLAKIQPVEENRRELDKLVAQVVRKLHSEPKMGGHAIHGFVSRVEPGFAERGNTLLRVVRLVWSGKSKTIQQVGA